jgi:hypothetical protein
MHLASKSVGSRLYLHPAYDYADHEPLRSLCRPDKLGYALWLALIYLLYEGCRYNDVMRHRLGRLAQ